MDVRPAPLPRKRERGRYAEGGNSREEGMELAREKTVQFASLAAESPLVVRGMVFDLRIAPVMWGPVTHGCIERMVRCFEAARRRIAVVVGEHAIQRLQIRRILKDKAPTNGRVFDSFADATSWARERGPARGAA
jgi:hypothetical protein